MPQKETAKVEPIFIAPNEWVEDTLLSKITGMTEGQIKNYRQYRWIEGIHYKRASSCNSSRGSTYKYNRIAIDQFSSQEKVA